MPRPRKLSRAEFTAAHAVAESMQDLAMATKLSLVACYCYCKRHHLAPVKRPASYVTQVTWKAYKGKITLEQLAEFMEVALRTARYYLEREVERRWSTPTKVARQFPKPKQLRYIKIIHALQEDPSLYDDSAMLAELVNLPATTVNDYLTELFEFRTEKEAVNG